MAPVRQSTPAFLWRAFFVSIALCAARGLAAPPAAAPPPLSQIGKPDAAEAARILEQFRQSGIPGEYYLEFELHELPRRGDERVYQGRLWSGRDAEGAITRVELADAAGNKHRLLIQNGEHAAVWRLVDGRTTPVSGAALFEPLIAGIEIAAFDVQMPFLYWPDAALQRVDRIRGRPANAFLFRAPPNFSAPSGQVAAARAYLDTQFNAIMQTELLDPNGRVLKTLSLVELKKIDDQWMPKSLDYRNEVTRDKTRLQVTAAALKLEFSSELFAPASLTEDVRAPAGKIVRIEP